MALAASLAPETAAADIAFHLHVLDHALDGGAAKQLAFDRTKDAAFLAGNERAVQIGGVFAAIALID
jgi:hypothetical protein